MMLYSYSADGSKHRHRAGAIKYFLDTLLSRLVLQYIISNIIIVIIGIFVIRTRGDAVSTTTMTCDRSQSDIRYRSIMLLLFRYYNGMEIMT